jgi:hypothetical protein
MWPIAKSSARPPDTIHVETIMSEAPKKRGYLHTPEECGTHDIDIEGECSGCGLDAITVVELDQLEAAHVARMEERRRIVEWIREEMVNGDTLTLALMIESGEHNR